MSPITAVLDFSVGPDEPEKGTPSGAVVYVATGLPLRTAPLPVPIHDLRAATEKPSLAEQGLEYAVAPYPGLDSGEEGWEDRYADDMAKWFKDYYGAQEVKAYNWAVRRRQPEVEHKTQTAEDYSAKERLQPATAVHVDTATERGHYRIKQMFGDAIPEGARTGVINIWRPLVGPVIDCPLTMCDATTLKREKMHHTTDSYGGGYFIDFDEDSKWWYLKDQMPDEVLVFRSYDSEVGPEKCTAHAAFIDKPRLPETTIPRQSIEVRLSVIY